MVLSAVGLLLAACGGGGSSSVSGVNVISVEDGPVLEAHVIDASGQIATSNGNSYTFANPIVYPVTVKGGFIDMNEDGLFNDGDYKLPRILKAKAGSVVTPVTTLVADLNETAEKSLLLDFSLSEADLKDLPSKNKNIALVSDAIMQYVLDQNMSNVEDINSSGVTGVKTAFDTSKSLLTQDANLSAKAFAKKLEEKRKKGSDEKGQIVSYLNNGFNLSLVHVNDTHSHLDSETITLSIDGVSTKVNMGGYPRMVTKISELEAKKTNTLTLNAGDTFQGTLYYSLFKGEADAAMLNRISWDALELGNHEFDDGDAHLAEYLSKLDINSSNILAANVVAPSGNVLYEKWSPYTIKNFNGEKVGIIGIDIAGKTKNSSNPSAEIVFNDEVNTTQHYINLLKTDHNITKIILLSHVGLDNDKAFVKELSGVDVVIGGDSHSLMGNFKKVGLTSHDNSYPYKTTDKDGNMVCIGHAWQYGYAIGNMNVSFDENGTVKGCDGTTTLLIGDTFTVNSKELSGEDKTKIIAKITQMGNVEIVSEDSVTKSLLKTYSDKVDGKKAEVIGNVSGRLGHNRIPNDTYDKVASLALGSDIAPIVAKAFYELSNLSDASIQNAGGVRIALESGEVTLGDAYTLLPFANTLFEIKMTGNEVKAVLEDAVDEALYGGKDGTISTGSFPYAYGLRYDVVGDAPKGSRIQNLEIMSRGVNTWSDINTSKLYTIVTNNYTAGGKDEYHTFKTAQENHGAGVDTYLDYAMSFVKYIENLQDANQSLTKLPQAEHPIKSFSFKSALKKLGSYETNTSAGSEISVYDATSQRLFVTNGAATKLDILDISDVSKPTLWKAVDLSSYGTGVNSVAVKNGKVAVAMDVKDALLKNDKGSVVIFDINGIFDKNITVGYLPDMLTFNEDGTKIVVANEGEPWVDTNGDYQDVIGSVGVITLSDGSYIDINFTGATLTDASDGTKVRIRPSSTQQDDLEPEYITVKDGFAYVTLQENNALAKINLSTNTIEYIKSFGAKSYETDNTIDIEENGKIEMKHFPGLYGLYQPDTITSYTVGGKTYLVTANEGDGREYPTIDIGSVEIGDAWTDEKKISKLTLDSSIASYYSKDNDLKVMIDLGASTTNGKGTYSKLYTYGGRSFSIWDSNGSLIWDSKDEFSKKVATLEPMIFNQEEGLMDGRSGNKGVEPEALAVGTIEGKTYAFIGLERQNGIMIYDITTPASPSFISYVNIQKVGGDISPESITFISKDDSPNGKNILSVANEVSGSTTLYEINLP